LLGALAAASGVVGLDALLVAVRGRFTGSVAEANADAVTQAFHRTLRSEAGGRRRAATG
jgi:Pyruvate/2-oxoacid:ferredoxin oxidoreductase gamma subunit